MGLLDRDYMRRRPGESSADSWWHDRSPKELIVLLFVGLFLLSVIGGVIRGCAGRADHPPGKGTLRVNINSATRAELESLPGIGESRAKLIIAHRPYQSVDDLAKLRGIGPSLTRDLRPFLKMDGRAERIESAR